MATRLILAYGLFLLMALLALAGGVAFARKRSEARRLRRGHRPRPRRRAGP